jgi:hypothetical protein
MLRITPLSALLMVCSSIRERRVVTNMTKGAAVQADHLLLVAAESAAHGKYHHTHVWGSLAYLQTFHIQVSMSAEAISSAWNKG